MPYDIQVGDSEIMNTNYGDGTSTGGGYGYGVNYGLNATTETVIPGVTAGQSAGADQSADFNRYLGMAQQAINLINPFTAQYQNEQGIRLTQAQTDLERARAANAGYAAPAKDNTLVFVIGGVAALGLLVFVSQKG